MGECLNCSEEASTRYRLALETGQQLGEGPLCPSCHAFFAASRVIEVREAAPAAGAADRSDG